MKNLHRYSQLIWELARIYFSHQSNKDALYRKTIFYSLKSWGGVYIKFLQILAGMSKFMDGWSGPREMAVFSQAPREPLNLYDYVNPANFRQIDTQPFATGSFALVYHGILINGEEVAIKILRPSIKKNLRKDLSTLRRLCWCFSRFLPQLLVNYNDAYAECERMFLTETNYAQEIANQQYFYKLYMDNPNVVIPKVYLDLSSDDVIVQELIKGPTLAEIMSSENTQSPSELTRNLTGSDLWTQIKIVGGEALFMAMCADYVYGDPHPGNIILLPDNRIGIIDFGIIADKPPSHQAFHDWVASYHGVLTDTGDFNRLLETTVTCFAPDLSIAMKRCNFTSGNFLKVLADSMTEKLTHEMIGNSSYIETFRNGHLIDVFIKVVDTKVISVNIETVNFKLIKAIQAFLGSVTILDNVESRHGFSNIMLETMRYALEKSYQYGIPNDAVTSTYLTLTDSYELIVNTISSLADNDEIMFNLVNERIFA